MEQNILLKARYTCPSSFCLLHYSNPSISPFCSFQKHPKILMESLSQTLLESPKYDKVIFVGVDNSPKRIYQGTFNPSFKMNMMNERGKIIEIDLYTTNVIKNLKEKKDINEHHKNVPFAIRLARYILNQIPNYEFKSNLTDNDKDLSSFKPHPTENDRTTEGNLSNETVPSVALVFDSISSLFPIFKYSYPDVKCFIDTLTLEGCKLLSNYSVSPILSVLDENGLYVDVTKSSRISNIQRWLAMIDLARINIEILPCTLTDSCLNHGTLKTFRKMTKNSLQTNPNLGRVQYDKDYYMIETKLRRNGSVITGLNLQSGLSLCPHLLGISSEGGKPPTQLTMNSVGKNETGSQEANMGDNTLNNSDSKIDTTTGGGFNIIMEAEDSSDEEDEEEDDDDLDI